MPHTLIGRLAQRLTVRSTARSTVRLTARLLPALALFVYGTLPVHAASFPVQAWTYATVGLSIDQPLAATSRRIPAAAADADSTTETMAAAASTLPELSNPTADDQASSPLEQISGYMHNRMAQALTPDGVAQTLRSFSNAGASSIAGDIAQSFIDQGADRLMDKLRGDFFRSINLNWRPGYGGREDLVQIDTVMSLWDGDSTSLFGQAGLQSRDGEGGLHAGLGYRAQPVAGIVLGANAFYDYLSDPEVSRYSLGLEVRSLLMDISGNWYQGLSDETLSDGRIAYSPDGFDVEFAGRLPYMPYLEATGRFYRWEGEGSDPDDLNGVEYGLRFFPVPLFTLKTVYDNVSGGGNDVGVEALIQYEFGVPLSEQLKLERVAFQADVWQRRFERVQRQYEQRVRYRGAGSDRTPDLEFCNASPAPAVPVCLRFRVPADAMTIRIGWALTATPGTGLTGSPVDLQRSDLTLVSGDRYSYDVPVANFDPTISYRFTVSFLNAAGEALTPALAPLDGPGDLAGTTITSNGLTLSWLRPAGALSARISWSQSGVRNAAGGAAVPLAENGGVTLDLTDTAICPSSGTTCSYPIADLQPGTQYAVTLELYSGADAGGTRLDSIDVMLSTTGTRPNTIIGVTASAAGTTEGGDAVTITLSASTAPNVLGGVSVPFTLTAGTGLMPSDYTLTDAAGNALTSPVNVPIGETELTWTLTALTDSDTTEMLETLTLQLDAPAANAGYELNSSQSAVTISISPPVSASFSGSDTVTVSEDSGTVELTIDVMAEPSTAAAVPIIIIDGTATVGSDYTVSSLGNNPITVAAGETTATVSIGIVDDTDDEVDETFIGGAGQQRSGQRSEQRGQ